MKSLTCEMARPLLNAFHDRELAIRDEIAVAAHLDQCLGCAGIVNDLRSVRSTMRASAGRHQVLSNDDAAGFTTGLVMRLKVERDASFMARVRLMFDDMHLVYATAGSVASAMVCVVMMLGMTRFAADNRPDSLGAIVNVLAMPAECETGPDSAEPGCRERWAERFQRANESAEQDAVVTLGSVVMRQGRLSSLAVLQSSRRRSASDQVKMIVGLLDAVSRARLAVQAPGVPGSVLRLVARATVRANKPPTVDVPQAPAMKKRAASLASAERTGSI